MKHVLITGGSNGLGKVTAVKLVESGFSVTILSQDLETTKAAAEETGCNYVIADVADHNALQTAVKEAVHTAPIDILINNAGMWIQGELESNELENIKRVMEVNVLGVIYTTQAVITGMKERKRGRIINIMSQGGLYAKAERSVYTASKWALTGFTKTMQLELKPFNISVDAFYPGALKSPDEKDIFSKAGNKRDMSKALDMSHVADAIAYACKLPDGVRVTELGIESLSY
ncbi:MAG: SDR family oxidoreductase [Patescibacteria group bacterium]